SLKFNAKAHRYWLDGKPIPGVTTLLGKGLPKPALPYWAAKCVAEYVVDNPDQVEQIRSLGRGPAVAALKAIPWQARDEAAVRGTDVHKLAEEIIHGREVAVPEHLVAHVEGYTRWLDEFEVSPILTERPVGHRALWYAGTFDAIVRIGEETWGLDWKTSKGVYGSTALQVAAYMGAEFFVDKDGNEQPLPEVDRIGVVHITEAGTRLHPFRDKEAAWKDWRHVSWVASRIPAIDDQLEDALEAPSAEGAAA
ncbi:MAG: hypothetical protein HOV66_15400, partial [Streptomycetaceae bacterium]|nr:hypothetical protein [Streptomycetaceae bacterium]